MVKLHRGVELTEEVGEWWNDGSGGEGERADEAAEGGFDGVGLHVCRAGGGGGEEGGCVGGAGEVGCEADG